MHDYEQLTPDTMLDAIESLGFETSGRYMALNSYENRVYDVELEDQTRLIAKFYRPNRWSNEAILEEHEFSFELAEEEIPVVPPMVHQDKSLHEYQKFRFSLFPLAPGRPADFENEDLLEQIGRFIARIHAIGAKKTYQRRPTINLDSYAKVPSQFLLEHDFIPKDLRGAYESILKDLFNLIENAYQQTGELKLQRIHADMHMGNILMNDEHLHIVDLDDSQMGPAIQDLWMFLSGDRNAMTRQLMVLLEGYNEFYDFNPRELHLVEVMRSLRMICYAGWLATRWDDPAFPMHFPWFNTQHYWEEHILHLREQMALLQEEPLKYFL